MHHPILIVYLLIYFFLNIFVPCKNHANRKYATTDCLSQSEIVFLANVPYYKKIAAHTLLLAIGSLKIKKKKKENQKTNKNYRFDAIANRTRTSQTTEHLSMQPPKITRKYDLSILYHYVVSSFYFVRSIDIGLLAHRKGKKNMQSTCK